MSGLFFCLALLAALPLAAAPARAEKWLAASDIHLDPFDRRPQPSGYQTDPNVVLFDLVMARMKRAVPDPAVVVLPGDFLMHDFAWHARWSSHYRSSDEAALATMRIIAGAFGRAYPHAQFVIALGNNDVPCGDYRSAPASPYLRALARIWEPLVNRHGASPHFATEFSRGGYYTADVASSHLRIVVLNTVLFSNRYRGACAGDAVRAGDAELAWLQTILASGSQHSVVVMHIPPGYDAFSTEFARGFLAVPFLAPRYNLSFSRALEAHADRIAFAIAAHAHLFDVRLAGHVPILIVGSVSPIYGNTPAFYALRLSPSSELRDIDAYPWDVATQTWGAVQHFDRNWDIDRIDGAALERVHAQFGVDAALRARWNAQAEGWRSDLGSHGTWGPAWRVAWCAQTELGAGFTGCAGLRPRLRVTHLLPLALIVVAVLIAAAMRARRFSRRR